MKKIIIILICLPIFGYGQIYTIDANVMNMSGLDTDYDISINTYYNAFDTCNIQWSIIKDSMPSSWDFSICFPNCYNVGIVNGQDDFFREVIIT